MNGGVPGVRVRQAACDDESVRRVREIVYVVDQQRLLDPGDTADSFDRYDASSQYFLALQDDEPIGTVKVIADSADGLPCGQHVDLGQLRARHRIAEVGHLLTVPTVRDRGVGMGLMREALVHAVGTLRATHILGDFFVDARDGGRLRPFYLLIGFSELGEPFPDERFHGSPLSRVGVLDVPAAARALHSATGRKRELMEFFYGDYDEYSREQ